MGNVKGKSGQIYGLLIRLLLAPKSDGIGTFRCDQRYSAAAAEKERTADGFCFHIENRYDTAYFFVRFSKEKPLAVTGGTMEQLTDSLYLLCADSDEVQVKTDR